ncbi:MULTISPECIES: hypothetical protein [Burkholderia cepacia complex]|uniref:hypothetical protein n=1 Tax=Burkholderia TaxID=32008 RepID=UPI00073A87E8|nr:MULTISPECIES: hypothetical protein [Burkholderia cepacia complex]ALV61616.1 hypothetical protein TQ36_35885 [Burkholderia cenocepacia]AQQ48051.1 hypothetical protein A8F32_19455 [Burkholderia cenocepacia]MCA7888379.1 hypothetical protein [Burkholderia contaminans]ONJ04230.1 hypothetical protein A8F33_24040 [Burkholderia cenocepacia]ONJ09500.1 hypothetical protein A8F53_00550 [Burkholderia cenocepacia]
MNNYDRLDFSVAPAVIDGVEKNSADDRAAALQHFTVTGEPTRYVVDVTNDQVVVSGKGVLATYYWRASPYDSRVARLSIQPVRQIVGDSSGESFRVVAGAVDDVHRPPAVLADHLSEVEAVELIGLIETGVKAALGIGVVPTHAVQLDVPVPLSGTVEQARRSISSKLLDILATATSRVVWVIAWGVAGAATGGVAVVLLPIVYRLGHHVGAHLVDFAFDVYPALRELLS